MLVHTWDYRSWANDWVITNEIYIPNTEGHHNVTLNRICSMSDRCYAYSPPDTRCWAYTTYMQVSADFNVSVDEYNNNISVTFNSWSNWTCVREPGTTPGGLRVVRGNYDWYSTVNGALIHNYIGPLYSGEGQAAWGGNGGTTSFNTGIVRPQTDSERQLFAKIHNNVNGVEAFGYISFFNDLPPDYRPGERKISGSWKSHDRPSGVAERLSGSWYSMRTIGGDSGAVGDPPEVVHSGWHNQKRLGEN